MNSLPNATPYPPLSVIIVNYNTSALLQNCLESIRPQLERDDEVLVVDNASSDGSVAAVREKFAWVTLAANDRNEGFAQANNQALAIARREVVWLLNPDTWLLPESVRAVKAYMQNQKDVGLAGTALRNPDGSVQRSVETRYPRQSFLKGLFCHLPGDIAWVLGASMVVWREKLLAVGGFDTDYFLYEEDMDLCLRIRKAGWPIGLIEECRVVHVGGQSERGSVPESVMKKKLEAELLFCRKHYPGAVIRKIRRHDRIKALWRLACLSPSHYLHLNRKSVDPKWLRYRLIWQMYRQEAVRMPAGRDFVSKDAS